MIKPFVTSARKINSNKYKKNTEILIIYNLLIILKIKEINE